MANMGLRIVGNHGANIRRINPSRKSPVQYTVKLNAFAGYNKEAMKIAIIGAYDRLL